MKEIRNCKVCNTSFRPKYSVQFCSINCLKIHRKIKKIKETEKKTKTTQKQRELWRQEHAINPKKQKRLKILVKTLCPTCGVDVFSFSHYRQKRKFCSVQCFRKSSIISIPCIQCKQIFEKIKSSKNMFCSERCKSEYKNILYKYELELLIDMLKEKKSKTEKRQTSRKCKRCGVYVNKKIQKHHIIPRKYGGKRWKWNKILLCPECHNYVELKTQEWIDSGGSIDVNILKFKILNDAF